MDKIDHNVMFRKRFKILQYIIYRCKPNYETLMTTLNSAWGLKKVLNPNFQFYEMYMINKI